MSKDVQKDVCGAVQMGSAERRSDAAVVESVRRGYFSRHPILTFIVAPIPMTIMAWIATFAALFGGVAGIAKIAESLGKLPADNSMANWPASAMVALIVVFWLGVVGPPAILNMTICRLARRGGVSWQWPFASCILVALIAGMFQAVLEPAATLGGQGRLSFGFGMWTNPPLQQWLQFLLPLSVGLGILWRQTHRVAKNADDEPDAKIVTRRAA